METLTLTSVVDELKLKMKFSDDEYALLNDYTVCFDKQSLKKLSNKTFAISFSGGAVVGYNILLANIIRYIFTHVKNPAVYCVRYGFAGYFADDLLKITLDNYNDVLKHPSTIFGGTCRNVKPFEHIEKIKRTLLLNKIDYVISCGGDGTCFGTVQICENIAAKVVFVPCSIDNMNKTQTYGIKAASESTAQLIKDLSDNAWQIHDYSNNGAFSFRRRIQCIKCQGKDRLDLVLFTLKLLLEDKKYLDTNAKYILISGNNKWSVEDIITEINATPDDKNICVIFPEASQNDSNNIDEAIGLLSKRLEFETYKYKKVNVHDIGYISQIGLPDIIHSFDNLLQAKLWAKNVFAQLVSIANGNSDNSAVICENNRFDSISVKELNFYNNPTNSVYEELKNETFCKFKKKYETNEHITVLI